MQPDWACLHVIIPGLRAHQLYTDTHIRLAVPSQTVSLLLLHCFGTYTHHQPTTKYCKWSLLWTPLKIVDLWPLILTCCIGLSFLCHTNTRARTQIPSWNNIHALWNYFYLMSTHTVFAKIETESTPNQTAITQGHIFKSEAYIAPCYSFFFPR